MGLALGAVPVALIGATMGYVDAYGKLRRRLQEIEHDRTSYLEVIEGSNDGLFVINFVNGRIYQANDKAAAMLGYTRDELAGLTIFQLHTDHVLHRSAQRIADAWQQQGAVYDDVPMLHANGDVIPVESSARVTSYDGKPAIILFIRDIRERLELQRQVGEQQAVVKRQNEELPSRIRYAQRIQHAVLPEAAELPQLFPESFILFGPRDIVSGDLFWFAEADGVRIVAAADCTGHGVPGELLSLIGASLFEEVVLQRRITEPAAILDAMREGFEQALNKGDDEAGHHDGMHASIAAIDARERRLRFAGAYHPLYLSRNGAVMELKGDRMPIGLHDGVAKPFAQHELRYQQGDRVYLFSDGITDQFGGPDGKKLRSAGLKQWLAETAALPMDDQHQALSDRFRNWKGSDEQIDDVLLIGVEL